MKGLISRIQRFSTHDGPGIRTTIFLKGCSMNCVWCHNPETISMKPEVMWFDIKCKNCGECVKVCPAGAHVMNSEGQHIFLRENCVLHCSCIDACNFDALELSGKEMTVEKVAGLSFRDINYYDSSGGGVTLSGGEPLVQPDFCGAILTKMKERGIHTAVDTALNVKWESVEKMLDLVDLWLVDFKISDSAAHKQYTGVPNDRILNNLSRLGGSGKTKIIIRIPVIKDINSDPLNMNKTGEFIKSIDTIKYVELLPYHDLGANKAQILGLESSGKELSAPDDAALQILVDSLKNHNISVKFRGEFI